MKHLPGDHCLTCGLVESGSRALFSSYLPKREQNTLNLHPHTHTREMILFTLSEKKAIDII